jgi:hypothetical protein
MAHYLIHTYPKRLWYVTEYLIPSMLKQGISIDDINIYNDDKGDGNLRACMNAFKTLSETQEGTWHLQDDIIIASNFKERTEAYDSGLVCGFSSLKYDGDIERKKGAVCRKDMWFSFPCIRIPNKFAIECADWITTYIIGNPVYEKYWKDGVNDDWAFRLYLKEFQKDCTAINMVPCLVNHIDYLIGGGSGKKVREHPVTAQYWDEDYLVEELKCQIENRLRG